VRTVSLLLPSLLFTQAPHPGKAVYDQWCAGCHGDTGAGDGAAAAFMLPRPRDFTGAVYEIRSTASGELPSDSDVLRVVEGGMPGTAMPGWKSRLSPQERADVIAYLKTFSQFFSGAAPTPLSFGKAPSESESALREGRQIYRKLECFKCHGEAGRGDGPSASSLKDDWGRPIRATDLTESWNFNGGAAVEEIYARLRTGLDGTPMPSFSDAIDSEVITEEQLWRVAQYVRSLSPKTAPEVREVIRAKLAPGKLPAGPADSLWSGSEAAYVPLVGQIIQKPRWFLPTVDGVWVQAVHDGTRLALRLSWHDPLQALHLGNLADFWTALEGVSHFQYLAWNAGFDRPVSIHELEVQAEVDKYAITLFLLGAQQAGRFPQRLHHWLFERARVDSALTRQKRELYASANRYAARFCRVLEDRFLQRRRVRCEALVRALRHFYRLTHAPKIRLIEIGHAH